MVLLLDEDKPGTRLPALRVSGSCGLGGRLYPTAHGLLECHDAAELAGVAYWSWHDFGENGTGAVGLGAHMLRSCVRNSDEAVCWTAGHLDFSVIFAFGDDTGFLSVKILDFFVIWLSLEKG